ncbi:hypothetical protein J6590_081482 [Homalodisca vitripennis]|nr:hypothetical protein J6590_081482 [Homalodisca vitripennis]
MLTPLPKSNTLPPRGPTPAARSTHRSSHRSQLASEAANYLRLPSFSAIQLAGSVDFGDRSSTLASLLGFPGNPNHKGWGRCTTADRGRLVCQLLLGFGAVCNHGGVA